MNLVAGLFDAYPLIAGLFDAYPKASSTKMIAALFDAYSLLETGTYMPSSVEFIWKIRYTILPHQNYFFLLIQICGRGRVVCKHWFLFFLR